MKFEETLARLEEIVADLDGTELPLDDALALFREGVEHLRAAAGELDRADASIKTLVEEADGTFVLRERDA
ncbi:MAG TPA: exodeoxyribonuclease VII small subunit [Gemmatimonadaceae bacterium]|jgi:exodeoxyribonuclease VII small subunit|nr:exodeoxyribonuclease VII small subunit [Gemmatimonadaceae bacterium]